MTKVLISFNNNTVAATFYQNDTADALLEKMPMSLNMMNLYSRELTYRFKEPLPAKKAKTSGYQLGDIGYWKPMHSFVIFYKQTGEVIDELQIVGHIDGDLNQLSAVSDQNLNFSAQE